MPIRILGAGPAGSAATISAITHGRSAVLTEEARFPRHKVCGEFLSPQAAPILDELGVWDQIERAAPARIERIALHFGPRTKTSRLPEAAYGFSRYALDRLLFERALALGATFRSGRASPSAAGIVACGRREVAPRGGRLFGFKSHFRGPANDAVELFFFGGGYVGVNPVEGDLTNVCGLISERTLQAHDFNMDAVVAASEPLAERVRPLARTMDWLATGPVVFRRHFKGIVPSGPYLAGDALGFVDPFTGSGILSALITGRLAGAAAARHAPVRDYLRQCARALERPYAMAEIFRAAIGKGWAEYLAFLVPGAWLYRLTRPRVPRWF